MGTLSEMVADAAIYAEGLVKVFGKTRALDGLDLHVEEGTLLALLGPNGAGKTTAVRILTTLLKPDAGRATVAGFDVINEPDRIKSRIGLAGQTAAIAEYLTGRENLEMIGRLYHLTARDAKSRAQELLEQFDLLDAADRLAKTYSGGMRRRLDLGASLVALPPVLFLDEPTTGLDPRSRRQMWGVISSLVAEGSTILLTTQYLDEADELANRIAVVDAGRVIAEGTSDELKNRLGGHRIEVTVAKVSELNGAAQIARRVLAAEITIDAAQRRLSGPTGDGTSQLATLVREYDAAGITILDLQLHRPSLDDVFLTLTGHQAEEKAAEPARRWGRRAS